MSLNLREGVHVSNMIYTLYAEFDFPLKKIVELGLTNNYKV